MRGIPSLPALLSSLLLLSAMTGPARAGDAPPGMSETSDLRARFRLALKPGAAGIDSSQELHFWWAAPKEWATQRLARIEALHPSPDSASIDPQNGNLIEFWDLSKQDEAVVEATFSWRALASREEIDPARIAAFDPDDEILQNSLKSDAFIRITADVEACALEMGRGRDNAYDKAKAFYEGLMPPPGQPASPESRCARLLMEGVDRKVLPGRMDQACALLFCALCRAAGIPARPVFGFLALPGEVTLHTWAEFYAPPYSWIPVDFIAVEETFARLRPRLGVPDEPGFYFGNLDSHRLILSKGTNVKLQPPGPAQNAGTLILDGRAAYLHLGVWDVESIPECEWSLTLLPLNSADPDGPEGRKAAE